MNSFLQVLGKDLEVKVPRSGTEGLTGRGNPDAGDVLFVDIVQYVRRVLGGPQDVVADNGSLRVTTEQKTAAVGGRNGRESGVPVREGIAVVGLGDLSETGHLSVGPEVPDPDGSVLRATREGVGAAPGEDRNAVDVPGVAGQRLEAPPLGAGADVPQFDGLVRAGTQKGVFAKEANVRQVGLVLGKGVNDLSPFDVPQQRGGIGGRREHLGGRSEEDTVGQISLVADQLGNEPGRRLAAHRVDRTGVVEASGGHKSAALFHADAHHVGRLEADGLFLAGGDSVPQQQIPVLARRDDRVSVAAPVEGGDLSKVPLEGSAALDVGPDRYQCLLLGGVGQSDVLLGREGLEDLGVQRLDLFVCLFVAFVLLFV